MLNQMQVMNNVMKALDGPGVEPKLWSEMTSIDQHFFCEEYMDKLYGDDAEEEKSLREQAARAYYNIIARHADRNGAAKDWVLG